MVYLGVYLKLASFTSDGGKDALGTGTGFLGWLNRDRSRLKLESVLHVDCDLHVLNRGLVVACTHVFGKPVMNRASVLQLLYLVSTVCRENWTLVSRLLQEACNELKLDLVVGKQPDVPLSTRWYTVISVAVFTLTFASALRVVGRRMFFQLKSSKKVPRDVWKQVDI